jgi:hypothetical protein
MPRPISLIQRPQRLLPLASATAARPQQAALGPGQEDMLASGLDVDLGGKLQSHASRPFQTPNNESSHAGNGLPWQTLDIVDGKSHILDSQVRAVDALLWPEREVVWNPVHIHKRFVVAVDTSGLGVEGNVKAVRSVHWMGRHR